MDLVAFDAALADLTVDDLYRVAKALDLGSLDDEVDWWRTTIAIDRALRHARASRHASRAAVHAVARVESCAVVAGLRLPDDDVTRVARSAAEIARGLAAGPGAAPIVRLLLEPWASVGVAA
ncbi:MAG: hypothetical protein ACKOA9_09450 [Actinomycetota bacterium]